MIPVCEVRKNMVFAKSIPLAVVFAGLLARPVFADDTVGGQKIIFEETVECGAGAVYKIPRGKLSEQKIDAARYLLNFLYSNANGYDAGRRDPSASSAVVQDVEKQMRSETFKAVAGADVEGAVQDLVEKRRALLAGQDKIAYEPENWKEYSAVPLVKQFLESKERADAAVTKTFGLTKIDGNNEGCE